MAEEHKLASIVRDVERDNKAVRKETGGGDSEQAWRKEETVQQEVQW